MIDLIKGLSVFSLFMGAMFGVAWLLAKFVFYHRGEHRAKKILKSKPVELESGFREGQILRMEPGYYTRKPYYVEVLYFDNDAHKEGSVKMITSIPGHHKCQMRIGCGWEYHHKRMTIIGYKSEFGYLLKNQSLK